MAQQHLAVAAPGSNVGGMVQLERPRAHAPPSRPGCIEAVYANAGGKRRRRSAKQKGYARSDRGAANVTAAFVPPSVI